MEVVKFMYQDQEVEFNPIAMDNVMVNATQMAKIFDKRIQNFMATEETKRFIDALKNSYSDENKFTVNPVNLEPLSDEEIISTHGRNGTFMHRLLALKFAAWLDPYFEVWVYQTIDYLINHYYREHSRVIRERMMLEKLRDEKRKELINDPKYLEYFRIEEALKTTNKRKYLVSKQIINQARMNFDN